jgi:RNA polymerase sigma-70 factor (ECF subfamily)
LQESKDEASFDSFFGSSWGRLQGLAYVLTASREGAQDLTQETLLRAWKHWDTLSMMDNPEAWARKVLQNLAADWWRKSRRLHRIVFVLPSPAASDRLRDDRVELEQEEGGLAVMGYEVVAGPCVEPPRQCP